MAVSTSESAGSIQHVIAVIQRWWLLIAVGTLVALALGAVVSVGSETHYTADTEVVVVQPAQLLAPRNEGAVQRLADLMNTISALATSDAVLEPARQAAGSNRSLDDMRNHVSASVVQSTLIVSIHTDFPTPEEAEKIGTAVATQFGKRLGEFSRSSIDPVTLLTLENVRAPIVKEVQSTLPRTLIVALVLGLGFSVLAAFALDRS